MKIAGLRFVSAMISIALLVPMAVEARDVPFTIDTVASAFDGARAVRTADLDMDGDLDILAAASVSTEEQVVWFENTSGDGSTWVQRVVSLYLSDGACSVGAADLDGDGDPDLYEAAGTDDIIRWWENDGTPANGGWSGRLVALGIDGANWVEAADVDGDGDLDLLGAAMVDGAVAWWENDGSPGDGGWVEHILTDTFNAAWSAKPADMDNDGDVDILAAGLFAETIAWWENDGTPADGGWVQRIVDDAYMQPHAAHPADLDGDGDLDVVGAGQSTNSITWWESDGSPADGGWIEHTVDSSFSLAYDASAADVDGDGDLDVLGAGGVAGAITWWENDGTPADGGWVEHTVDAAFAGASSVHAADVDGDGDTDLLGAARNDDDIAWWENGTIHRSAVFPAESADTIDDGFAGEWPGSLAVADLDRDGHLDVIAADPDVDEIVWWESDGTPENGGWTRHADIGTTYSGASGVDADDMDGDGDIDLVGSFSGVSPGLAWWENDGSPTNGGWLEHPVATAEIPYWAVEAVDIDNDGDPDLLFRYLDSCTWYENDGTGGLSSMNAPGFGCPAPPSLADIDNDGLIDMILGGTSAVVWEENVGREQPWYSYIWSSHTITNVAATAVGAGDLDGDGDVDVLTLLPTEVSWWENDGTPLDGGWTEHAVDDHGGADRGEILAADMDADGDLDILAVLNLANDVIWWENDGTPLNGGWTEHVVDDAFSGVHAAEIADLDGDGDPDLLAAADTAGEIVWWQNRGGQFALPTGDLAPSVIKDGELEAILDIEIAHRGRVGDSPGEIVTLELLFESQPGTPMTSTQANELIGTLYLYRDDGDGVFDITVDLIADWVSPLTLTGGKQTISFSDGDVDAFFSHDSPQRLYVVISARSDASTNDPHALTVTHLIDGTANPVVGTAEDRDHDIPLTLEGAADVSSSTVTFVSPNLIFADDFESGNTSAWSSAVP